MEEDESKEVNNVKFCLTEGTSAVQILPQLCLPDAVNIEGLQDDDYDNIMKRIGKIIDLLARDNDVKGGLAEIFLLKDVLETTLASPRRSSLERLSNNGNRLATMSDSSKPLNDSPRKRKLSKPEPLLLSPRNFSVFDNEEITLFSPTLSQVSQRYTTGRQSTQSTESSINVKEIHNSVLYATEQQLKDDKFIGFFERFDKYWQPFLLTTYCYATITTLVRVSLQVEGSLSWLLTDSVTDIILISELFLVDFYRPAKLQGLTTVCREVIRERYFSRHFVYNIIALLPIYWLPFLNYNSYARLNRILLSIYTTDKFVRTMTLTGSSFVERVGRSIFLFAYVTCFVAAAWCALNLHEGKEATLAWNSSLIHFFEADTTVFHKFTLGCDYAIKAMAGMSRGSPVPHTDKQTIFEQIVACLGVCMYATIIATIGTQIRSHAGSAQGRLNDNLDCIRDALRYKGFPRQVYLEAKHYNYFEHQSSRLHGAVSEVLSDLPLELQVRVDHFVGEVALCKVPLLSCVVKDVSFLHFLMDRLEIRLFYKSEEVYARGDWCDSMYFISSGSVIVNQHDEGPPQVLCSGDSVGELALLHVHQRRETVLAAEHSACLVLYRSSFLEAEEKFPNSVSTIRKSVEQSLNFLNQEDDKRRKAIEHLLRGTDFGILGYYYGRLKSNVAITNLKMNALYRKSTTNMRLRALKARNNL